MSSELHLRSIFGSGLVCTFLPKLPAKACKIIYKSEIFHVWCSVVPCCSRCACLSLNTSCAFRRTAAVIFPPATRNTVFFQVTLEGLGWILVNLWKSVCGPMHNYQRQTNLRRHSKVILMRFFLPSVAVDVCLPYSKTGCISVIARKQERRK